MDATRRPREPSSSLELSPENANAAYGLACVSARDQRDEDALTWLRRAVEWGYHDRGVIEWDPDLARLRAGPEIAAILREIPTVVPKKPTAGIVDTFYPDPIGSPDGQRLVTASGKRPVVEWDLRTGRILSVGEVERPQSQEGCFQEDRLWLSDTLAILLEDRRRQLSAVLGGDLLWTLSADRGFHHKWTIVAPNVTGWFTIGRKPRSLLLLDRLTGETLQTVCTRVEDCYSSFSPDCERIATGCRDGSIRVWSTRTGEGLLSVKGTYGSSGGRFSPDGKILAKGGWGGAVRLWDAEDGALLHAIPVHANLAVGPRFDPTGTRFFSYGSDLFSNEAEPLPGLWDVATGACIARLVGPKGRISASAWSSDGSLLAAGGVDREVYVWEGQTGRLLRTLRQDAVVRSLAFDPDGDCLVTGLNNGNLHLYDTQSWKLRNTLVQEGLVELELVRTARFDHSGRFLLTSGGLQVLFWDTKAVDPTSPLWTRRYPAGGMSSVIARFDPGCRYVLTSGPGHWTNRVLDARDGSVVANLEDSGIGSADFSPNGEWMLSRQRTTTKLFDTTTWSERIERRDFEGEGSLLSTPSLNFDGAESAARWAFVELDGKTHPLDGYASLLLDPKRVRASLAKVDLAPVKIVQPPRLRIEEPAARFLRVDDDGLCRISAKAEDPLGILRFELLKDGELVDRREIADHVVLSEVGQTARLEWSFELTGPTEVADVEVRAVNERGVLCGPRLVTFHRAENPPVFD